MPHSYSIRYCSIIIHSRCAQFAGILDDKVGDGLDVDATDNADGDEDNRGSNVDDLSTVDNRSGVHLKIDFPWEASESTC